MAKSATRETGLEFEGKKAEKELAEVIFGLFQARGAFFAATAPIALNVENIGQALESMGQKATDSAIQQALDANRNIFAQDSARDDLTYVTTKNGTPPKANHAVADSHGLAERFATPEPTRERVRPRTFQDEAPVDSDRGADATPVEFPPDSWQAAVAAALREAGQESPDVILPSSDREEPGDELEALDLSDDEEVVVDVVEDDDIDEIVVEEAPLVEEVIVEEVVAEPVEIVEAVEVEEVVVEDATDDDLAAAIELSLAGNPDAVRWGDNWMHVDNVPDLSQDNLNKLQELLGAASEPVSDYALVRDLGTEHTPGSEDFEIERFTLNFRMSQSPDLFEFAGTARQSLWTTPGAERITSPKREVSVIGQDYAFLLNYSTPEELAEPGVVEHVLTFYEHRLGVLPLNQSFQSIMPKSAFDQQRSTRLTFESPQTFETFDVDLCYPSGDQGGYLIGFEEYFSENLIPGAVVTIEATREQDTHFIIDYFQVSRQDRKLLQLNERRAKFVFQPTTYYCATREDMLVDENHFDRLADAEPLDSDALPDAANVVRVTFERVGTRSGDGDDPTYAAHIINLLVATNIERPFSEAYLRAILLDSAHPEFTPDENDEDVFIYAAQGS